MRQPTVRKEIRSSQYGAPIQSQWRYIAKKQFELEKRSWADLDVQKVISIRYDSLRQIQLRRNHIWFVLRTKLFWLSFEEQTELNISPYKPPFSNKNSGDKQTIRSIQGQSTGNNILCGDKPLTLAKNHYIERTKKEIGQGQVAEDNLHLKNKTYLLTPLWNSAAYMHHTRSPSEVIFSMFHMRVRNPATACRTFLPKREYQAAGLL